eukprot:4735169-Pyramimonas_sp.AAC.1
MSSTKEVPRLEVFHAWGTGRPYSFDTFLGDRNYDWDVVLEHDGNNITLGPTRGAPGSTTSVPLDRRAEGS